ncbi:aldo/keto reductase [Runella salmonicolor]|uniref:Aldo/keto reductase n=1 Tax=Runella salmonicolor TaxID=2950278 RepID=A0ABT1FSC1_9BACT|nr:aldo/keto reductase [Runella salmonicolor]MCP1384670.1 aldo/keto reductase [Runella salmonicolor]
MDSVDKSRRAALNTLGVFGAGMWLLPSFPFSSKEQNMIKRKIPSSGEPLPIVGLGTWQQFDVGLSDEERRQLTEVLTLMIEKGGRLIDSSPMYGRAEAVIGELAAPPAINPNLFYATKVWTTGKESGIREMNDSMAKMRRKTLDLMQVHNLVDYKTHLQTLYKWKEEGKIRYIGITHYTASAHETLERVLKSEKIDFVQFNYSIRERNAEKRLLNAAREKGVAVIINEPFESGSLFNAVKGKKLPEWAAENDIQSWGQYFLKYILANEAVNCVIPGTSNPKHVVDNMGAGFGRLPDEKLRLKMIEYLSAI